MLLKKRKPFRLKEQQLSGSPLWWLLGATTYRDNLTTVSLYLFGNLETNVLL